MGHIGHEHRLQTTGVVGPLRLLFQPLLLVDEIVDIPHDTITALQTAILIEERRTVDDVPLHVFAFVEERMHIGDRGTGHIEIFLRLYQSLTERTVNEMVDECIEIHLTLWGAKCLEEVALPLGERGAEEAHITGIH